MDFLEFYFFYNICYNNTRLKKRKANAKAYIMKKIIKNQKKCFMVMVLSIIICEILLNFDNKVAQSLGMIVVPFAVLLGLILMTNSEKGME